MAVTRSFKRFICVLCVHYGHPSVTECQPVARGQLVLVASLPLPCAFWQLNVGHQAWGLGQDLCLLSHLTAPLRGA